MINKEKTNRTRVGQHTKNLFQQSFIHVINYSECLCFTLTISYYMSKAKCCSYVMLVTL